jgi:hypothetical protein
MTENTDSGNLFEWLKGKKTYLLVVAAFIYGGGIQIHLWDHYPLVDTLLAGGTVASLRAGISKVGQTAKLILVGALCLGLTSCGSTSAKVAENIAAHSAASPIAAVGQDFAKEAAAAMQAYADYKAGNVSLTWALQTMFNAYADATTATSDVHALIKAWTGNSGDAQTLRDRIDRIFASSTAPPDVKMQALAQIAANTASSVASTKL